MTDPPVDPRTEYVPVTDPAFDAPSVYGDDAYADSYEPAPYDDPEYLGGPTLLPDPALLSGPRKPRVRKVSRVVRAIDAWSVFKISIIFYFALYVICLIAGVLLWNVAYSTGTIDNLSNFFESFGWKSFEFRGGEIFHNAWILGLFLVAALTGLNVVLATLFNLIADLVGGVRLTVLEEEVVVRRVDAAGHMTAGHVTAGHVTEGATSPVLPASGIRRRWWRG